MNHIKDAIHRIRQLECPTGDLENRVSGILEQFGVAGKDQVNISRDTSLDREEAQAYRVETENRDLSLVVLARSGYDDYVAKVVDVYSGSMPH